MLMKIEAMMMRVARLVCDMRAIVKGGGGKQEVERRKAEVEMIWFCFRFTALLLPRSKH